MNQNNFLLKYLYLFFVGIATVNPQSQSLALYTSGLCSGQAVTFNNSGTYKVNDTISRITYRAVGMWRVSVSGSSLISNEIVGGTCYELPNTTNNGSVNIQMYGNQNLSDSSSITVYNGKTLEGPEWTFNTSSNFSNVNAYMQSYIFTGSETSWLLYDEYNYNGTPTCLGPSETVQIIGFGITFSWNKSLSIKSIRPTSYCPSEPELTTTESDSSGVSSLKSWKEASFGIVAALAVYLWLRN